MRPGLVLSWVVLMLLVAGCTDEPAPPTAPTEPTWFLADLTTCAPDNATLPPCEGNLTELEVLPPTLPQPTWTCLASDAQTDYGFAVYWNLADSRLGLVYRVSKEGAHYPGWVRVQTDRSDETFAIPGTNDRGLVIFPAGLTANVGDAVTMTGFHMSANYTSNRTEISNATPSVTWHVGTDPGQNDTARVHVFRSETTYYLKADNVTTSLVEGTDFFIGLSYNPFNYVFETTVEPQPSACGT